MYRIGQKFIDREDNNNEYILALVKEISSNSYKVALISLEDGISYLDKSVKVGDINNITEDEFADICDDDQDDFELKEEKEGNMNLEEAYLKMQEECGIKKGDKVKVLRKAESGELGWDNTWPVEMDNCIGEIGHVDIIGNIGIFVKFGAPAFTGWDFPFFVLEKVEEKYYCVGDKFKRGDEEAILFQVGASKIALLSLENFNRYCEPVEVEYIHRITKKELSEITMNNFSLFEKSPLRKER